MSRKNSVPSRVSQNKGVLKLSERFGCQYFSPLHDLANWRKFELFSTLFCPSFIFQASLKGLRLTPCEGVGGWFPLGALLPPQPDGSRRLRLIWVDNSKFTILVIFLRKEATKNEKKKPFKVLIQIFPSPTHHRARRLHSRVRMQFWLTE